VSKEAALTATVVAGGLVAIQAPMNARLADHIGKFGSATMNFLVGGVLLVFITFVLLGGFQSVGESPPWWGWVFGGMAGAAYVTTALSSVPALGAGGVTAATVAGQLTVSVIADKVGLLDLPEKPISVGRMAGVVLLGLGVFLIVRE
jgi:bacterial/archaeal transporter family-2 protein